MIEEKNKGEEQLVNEEQLEIKRGEVENQSQSSDMNYYNEFCRLYLINTILTTQLKQLTLQKNDLLTKLTRLQKRAEELSEGNTGQLDEKKRRVRRSASEIARHYKCNVEGCSKSYGSEGSLNQHIKIKHPELFRSMGNYLSNHPVKESQEESESD